MRALLFAATALQGEAGTKVMLPLYSQVHAQPAVNPVAGFQAPRNRRHNTMIPGSDEFGSLMSGSISSTPVFCNVTFLREGLKSRDIPDCTIPGIHHFTDSVNAKGWFIPPNVIFRE
jgi:hypothetical protein